MRDTIDMAREAGCDELYAERVLIGIHFKTHSLKTFEALVRADEREICTNAALAAAEEAVNFAMALEREACAKVCEDAFSSSHAGRVVCDNLAYAIRERSSSHSDSANAGARGNT
jgi:hypothetical protein